MGEAPPRTTAGEQVEGDLEDADLYVETRRFREQRWLLDATIAATGVDWDQARSRYLARVCPPDAERDFARVRQRVRKFADIHREFAAAARRREALADQAKMEERAVAEREHSFVASILWGGAQWPLFGNSALVAAYNERKVAGFRRFIATAARPIRRVEIPFRDRTLPAYLHLPAGEGPFPVVASVGGMDSFKEHMVALYGDRFLERGIAVLAFDGPGQGESLVRGLWVTGDNFVDAGRAVVAWLGHEPAIRPDAIAVAGFSFGSFWATQIAGAVEGIRACAVMMVVHEPRARTLFEAASPTFKSRFMYMAGYGDEAAFDETFVPGIVLENSAPGIGCPFLVIAGEDDDLSPIEHTWSLLTRVPGPREFVLYEGERHGIGGGAAGALGPNPDEVLADWLAERLAGAPMDERLRYVTGTGTVVIRPLDLSRRLSPD